MSVNTKIKYVVGLVEMWKKQSEHKNYMLTNVGILLIMKITKQF